MGGGAAGLRGSGMAGRRSPTAPSLEGPPLQGARLPRLRRRARRREANGAGGGGRAGGEGGGRAGGFLFIFVLRGRLAIVVASVKHKRTKGH